MFLKSECKVRKSIGFEIQVLDRNSISQYSADDPLVFFDGIKKGNWFDLGCIAISSQLDRIVTDDNDQFAFAKLAHERGLIKASPLRSGDFLDP